MYSHQPWMPLLTIAVKAACLRQSLNDIAPYPDSSQNQPADAPLAWVERCLIRGEFLKLFQMLQQLASIPIQQKSWVSP